VFGTGRKRRSGRVIAAGQSLLKPAALIGDKVFEALLQDFDGHLKFVGNAAWTGRVGE